MKTSLASVALTSCLAFAQAPPMFEVASIKQAAPQQAGRMMVRMGGDAGRIDYANVSLKDVLAQAYNVKRYQISGPDWLDSERYDITAKLPDGVPKDQAPIMLQALLNERFKMAIRKETKEELIYALVVGKGGVKLKKSEEGTDDKPKTITTPEGAKITAPKGGMMMAMNGNNGTMTMTANGTTLQRFADQLGNMLNRPVLNQTEIQGNYDISLDVSMEDMAGLKGAIGGARMMMGGVGGGAGADHGPAPDSSPAPSLFQSVQSLGLKLETRKGPVDHIVVDRADKVPTEN